MSRLRRAWGTCDGADIIFREIEEDAWTAEVPADLQDGQYIIEIWGETFTGYVIYTTAVLYLCDSRFVGLRLMEDGIFVRIGTKEYQIDCEEKEYDIQMHDLILHVYEKYREEGGDEMRLKDLDFILGERKAVQFEVNSTKNEPVVVTEARWTLSDHGAEVMAGECTIDGNRMEVLLEPEGEGRFELTVTYSIPPEIRKVRRMVNVNRY